MRQGTASIFRIQSFAIDFTFLSLILMALGCAEMEINDPPVKEPVSQVFTVSYEKVWRAVQLATRRFPLKINVYDAGVLETDYIKGDKLFSDPNNTKPPAGVRYKIIVHAIKGTIDNQNRIKVIVQKQAKSQSDFFTGYRPIDSNGLEEKTILYRISRYADL